MLYVEILVAKRGFGHAGGSSRGQGAAVRGGIIARPRSELPLGGALAEEAADHEGGGGALAGGGGGLLGGVGTLILSLSNHERQRELRAELVDDGDGVGGLLAAGVTLDALGLVDAVAASLP